MPELGYNNLFSESGPQNMLDYLQSRLAARDLSADEALAMLGAVHQELNNPANADRAAYQKYSEFMESLKVEMPDVHDYVVSAWEQRGENKDDKADEPNQLEEDHLEGGEELESGEAQAVKNAESESLEPGSESDEEGGE